MWKKKWLTSLLLFVTCSLIFNNGYVKSDITWDTTDDWDNNTATNLTVDDGCLYTGNNDSGYWLSKTITFATLQTPNLTLKYDTNRSIDTIWFIYSGDDPKWIESDHHDMMLLIEHDAPSWKDEFTVLQCSTPQYLHRNEFSFDLSDWTNEGSYNNVGSYGGYDDLIEVDGYYYLVDSPNPDSQDGVIWRSSNISNLNGFSTWGAFPTHTNTLTDTGVFEENGWFHLFGEGNGSIHGNSGVNITHWATNVDPPSVNDWVYKGITCPGIPGSIGYGDPVFFKIDDVYHLVLDNSTGAHPIYHWGHWFTTDINATWIDAGNIRSPDGTGTDATGINDPDVKYSTETHKFYLVGHGHNETPPADADPVAFELRSANETVKVEIDTDNDAVFDTTQYINFSENITDTLVHAGEILVTGFCDNVSLISGYRYRINITLDVNHSNPMVDTMIFYTESEPILDEISFISINGVGNTSYVNEFNRTFKWTNITNATRYHLQVDNSSTFASPFINLNNINETNYPSEFSISGDEVTFVLPSQYNITYVGCHYYRVRAFIGGG